MAAFCEAVCAVTTAPRYDKTSIVAHDIGNMVGYSLAVQYPERIARWVVIDAPLPGIGNWDEIKQSPLLWHFNFRGPDEERLVAGRKRIYLDRGAEKSFGAGEASTLRFVANNVTMGIIPASGHWIMDENPEATTTLIADFLAK